MTAHSARDPIIVTHEEGVKFVAQIRSHRVLVDQEARGGGDDMGPSPIELLGAALGTCVAFYVQQFCHSRSLPYDGLRVEVESHASDERGRIGRFNVHVVLPYELPPQYITMLDRVARSCPVHDTLAFGAEIAVSIMSPAPSVGP